MISLSIEELVAQYRQRIDADLIKAIAAAYASITCSDGTIDSAEVKDFYTKIKDSVALSELVSSEMDFEFTNFIQLFTQDYELGLQATLDALGRVKDRGDDRLLVIRAAQTAIVADQKLSEQEETLIVRLCQALDLDSTQF